MKSIFLPINTHLFPHQVLVRFPHLRSWLDFTFSVLKKIPQQTTKIPTHKTPQKPQPEL